MPNLFSLKVVKSQDFKNLLDRQGKVIAYFPTGDMDFNDLSLPQYEKCYHDKRIGWVVPREFDTYTDFMQYLKDSRDSSD